MPGILILRPVEQAQQTIQHIEQLGWQAIHFPTVEIKAANSTESGAMLNNLEQYDWIIFVSQNAVRYFMQQVQPSSIKLPRIAAVGNATALAIETAGLSVSVLPQNTYSSEGLLQSSDFIDVSGQHILIVRGNGGRELIAETLRQRGASVSYAEVYRRQLPETDTTRLEEIWHSQIDVILATSNQLLDNLVTLVAEKIGPLFFSKPVVVISSRMQRHAQQLGFSTIWLAEGPSNDQMIETLKTNLTSS